MLNKARLKLTAWYLVIIFFISGLFSVAFYQVSTREIQRIVLRTQMIQEEQSGRFNRVLLPPLGFGGPSIEELEAVKQRLLMNLILINGVILVIAGGAAYFLAGRTLMPIKLMVDEQNKFISNSSHELRTPLSTLRAEMESSLLEKHISDKKARQLINSNLEEIGKLQGLSNKLLQLAKLHNPAPTRYEEQISLQEIIESTIKQVKTLTDKKQIKFDISVEDAVVQGEKDSLRELFVILLDNALKYSPQESKISLVSKMNDDEVKILVKDQGIGISEEDQEHIFERFYRSDKSRFQADGFGLGLSIAKQIVEKHNGSIKVVSKVGNGSTFTVSLPLVQS